MVKSIVKLDWKKALQSIFVGAVIAFFTVFLEGLLDWLRGLENNFLGGVGSALYYAIKSRV